MKGFLRIYGAAVAAGVALALCFPTYHLFFLAWVALTPLFVRTLGAGPREAAKQFALAGLVFHLILLQWLLSNFMWAGGWAFWGFLLLSLLMAGYWGLFGATWAWLRQGFGCAAVLAAMAWPAMELLAARLFTGFGWSALAHSQGKDLALLQLAAVGGTPLVAAVLVYVNVHVAQAVREHTGRARHVAVAVAVIALSHAGGALLLDQADYTTRPLRVGLVQSNYSLEMKLDPDYTLEMVRYAAEKSRALAAREQVDLLVWPEAAIMGPIDALRIAVAVKMLVRDTGCALFTGAVRQDDATGGDWNSSYLLDRQCKVVAYYDKVHLAPFGEYVPLGDYLPLVARLIPAIGDVEAGDKLKVLPVGGRRMGPLICFEVVFPELAEALRGQGADMLVVVTNLAWFGASNAIAQELEIARVRAVETRLPLVHSANTGISGVFDPWGRFTPIGGYGRPADTIMRRLEGALPVAAPGSRPVPYGPQAFPWAALAFMFGLAAARATKAPRRTKNS